MKKCNKCGQTKEQGEFYKKKDRHSGRALCKICDIARVVKRRNEKRKYLFEYYKTHPCVDCGETNPVVLELDHVRGEKVGNVSSIISSGVSMQKLVDEIAKCDVRCGNCHKIKTAQQQGWYKDLI